MILAQPAGICAGRLRADTFGSVFRRLESQLVDGWARQERCGLAFHPIPVSRAVER